MLAQVTDIETAIEREPDFFQALVENSQDLIAVLDLEGRELSADQDAPLLAADPGQLGQALVSLVLNAVEAIGPQRGTIRVAAGLSAFAEREERPRSTGEPLRASRYASLTVEDDGCGMDAAILARVFEPFFTTKFTGRGLGLSAVLGIVRGHGGAIAVSSRPGQGSRFELLFPLSGAEGGHSEQTLAPRLVGARPDAFLRKPYRGSELVRLVERLLGGDPS